MITVQLFTNNSALVICENGETTFYADHMFNGGHIHFFRFDGEFALKLSLNGITIESEDH